MQEEMSTAKHMPQSHVTRTFVFVQSTMRHNHGILGINQ